MRDRLQVDSRATSIPRENHTMPEEWKDIKGYEGCYYVSNKGRIKNRTRLLNPYKTQKGYMGVRLTKNGKVKNYLVHRLVAMAFVENTGNYPTVNHIDENKQNNASDNLEWCSYSYNNNYGKRNEKVSTKMSQKVVMIGPGGKETVFAGIRAASKSTGIQMQNICKVLSKTRKTAGGCRWKRL